MDQNNGKIKKNPDLRLIGLLAGAILIAAVIVAALVFVAPASPAISGTHGDIRIGAIYNLNGSQSSLDIPSARGAELAAEAINNNGGIGGRTLNLIMIDGKSDPAVIQKAATTLVNDKKVTAIIGMSDTDMVIPAA